MKKQLLFVALVAMAASAFAQEVAVSRFRHVGPLPLLTPARLDTTDVNGKPFDDASLLKTPLRLERVWDGELCDGTDLRTESEGKAALHLLSFEFTNTDFTCAEVAVEGVRHYELYLDGTQMTDKTVELQPATHRTIVKVLSSADHSDTLRVMLKPKEAEGKLPILLSDLADAARKRLYTLDDVMHARRYSGVGLSADGRWMTVQTVQTQPGGEVRRQTEVREVATGRLVYQREQAEWMPLTNRFYYTRTLAGRRELVTVDPQTLTETVMVADLPEGYFVMSPTEDKLLYTLYDEGPKERPDVYEVIHPDDRQPGWRTRTHLAVYDIARGLMQPLTFGHTLTYLLDVSRDGRQALVMTSFSELGGRTTEKSSVYRIDLQTLAVDTLFSHEGFLSGGCFSPDGRQVLMKGSPEAFGGIGKNVREGQTPSMIDMQLFLVGNDGRVRPLTRNFNPNVQHVEWCLADGNVYFTAEDKDSVNLFCLVPQTGIIRRIALPEEMVGRYALGRSVPRMVLYGQSASNSDRLYAVDLREVVKNGRKASSAVHGVRMLEDLSAQTLKGIELGVCEPYVYVNPQGDSILCRYYLPPHFDASARYPMIVNYYGGCSPTSRNFESRYPHHAYAAQGYVVLVVNPSGATGFGQERSARHVNTAGEGVAQDIIGAVQSFCAAKPWVDAAHIGCIGASYGGFMTQYLQTKTDLFAAAISHAGISDHTSYWGEGYWGYTYSEVSMAGSYPWTRKDLYVERSPLFNAEKIHTPLLFLHGDADHNVPVGESIQMYTALKQLGRPTAMVLVRDQDHHISDYVKRQRWQQTIFAWFARYLKGDASWWQSMYPDKTL